MASNWRTKTILFWKGIGKGKGKGEIDGGKKGEQKGKLSCSVSIHDRQWRRTRGKENHERVKDDNLLNNKVFHYKNCNSY